MVPPPTITPHPPTLAPATASQRWHLHTFMTSRLLSFSGGGGQRGECGGGEKGGGRQIPKGLPTGPTPRAGRYALFPIRTPSTMLRLHHYRITRVFQAPSSIFPQCWGDTGQAAAVHKTANGRTIRYAGRRRPTKASSWSLLPCMCACVFGDGSVVFTLRLSKHGASLPQKPRGLLGTGRRGMEVGEEGDYIPIATLRLIQGCRFYGALKRRNDFTVCVDQV